MKNSQLIWTYTIRWGNPYTRPPEGQADVLETSGPLASSAFGGSPACPPGLHDRMQQLLGSGYGLFLSYMNPVPRRQLSLETKQRIRRQRLERRLRAKVPLFADQLIADELARRPEYFGATQ